MTKLQQKERGLVPRSVQTRAVERECFLQGLMVESGCPRPVLQFARATLRKGRLRGAATVGTLLFPGYNSERAIGIFMRCEVGAFAAAGPRLHRQDARERTLTSAHERERAETVLLVHGLQRLKGSLQIDAEKKMERNFSC